MAIEKLRTLSLLVWAASISALLSGDFPLLFFMIQVGATLPLWFDINLVAIRKMTFWKVYGLCTFLVFGGSLLVQIPLRTAIFFLVLFCLIFEFYGEPRDKSPIRIIGLLSFLLVVHHARIESGLLLSVGILIYFFAVVWCLYTFHRGRFTAFRPIGTLLRSPSGLFLHVTGSLLVGMLIFWFIPRFPGQNLGTVPSLRGQRISGFAHRVTLTDIGTLKTSRKHVMDVTPLDGGLHTAYLKGRALEWYNKGIWSTSIYNYRFPDYRDDEVYQVRETDMTPQYRYSIDLEPLYGNTIFFFNDLIELRGNLEGIQIGGELNNISLTKSFPTAFSYTVTAVEEGSFSPRRVSNYSYLQMPNNMTYFEVYADSVLGEQPLDDEDTARRLKAHFDAEFNYTLEINNMGVEDPLYNFLIERKEGHCELFASSMVLLLRSRDIPARLVTGFLLTEAHPAGFYHVTEADAHAWVEYYADGAWQTIDPTPPSAYIPPSFTENQLAFLKRFWRTTVISWDFESQKALFRWFAQQFRTIRWVDWLWVLGLFSAGYAVRFLLRWRRNSLSKVSQQYQKVTAFLEQHYRPRRSNETLTDYVRTLQLAPTTETALLNFFNAYFANRFQAQGGGMSQTETLRRAGEAMQRLRGA